MQHAAVEEIARGNVGKAQRLARRRIVGEDDYRRVAKLIEAAAGVKRCQPGVLELSGISLVSLWDQNTWVELARTRSATAG